MIDWHSHILPGIDDGSESVEQSLAMAARLSAHGFKTVHCTPHLIRGCFEATNSEIIQAMAELQEQIDAAAIPLTLQSGREYYLDEYLQTFLENPLPLGSSRQVLVEIPPRTTSDMVRQVMYRIVRSGLTPVIAHPERCHLLEPSLPRSTGRSGLFGALKGMFGGRDSGENDPAHRSGNALLDYLCDLGCGFQGNLGSFSGFYGPQIKTVAESLRSHQIYDRFGSDLHSPAHADRILRTDR